MVIMAFHIIIGSNFYFWRREVVSEKVVSTLLYRAVSPRLATRVASELAVWERSGNIIIFTVSPTSYGLSI